MEIEDRIVTPQKDALIWDFNSPNPYFSFKVEGECLSTHQIDPFPGSSHDLKLVHEIVRQTEALFPIEGFPPFYVILPFETASRTNGWCEECVVRYRDKRNVCRSVIWLAGKRIPIMPAMTRYLIPHEYGHAVDNYLCQRRGLTTNGLDKEYAEMRGCRYDQGCGGGRWSSNIGEIIANDFRIVICNAEVDFWPHPCEHPNEVDAVREWWDKQKLLAKTDGLG